MEMGPILRYFKIGPPEFFSNCSHEYMSWSIHILALGDIDVWGSYWALVASLFSPSHSVRVGFPLALV